MRMTIIHDDDDDHEVMMTIRLTWLNWIKRYNGHENYHEGGNILPEL